MNKFLILLYNTCDILVQCMPLQSFNMSYRTIFSDTEKQDVHVPKIYFPMLWHRILRFLMDK